MHLRNRYLQNKIKIGKNRQKSPNYALGAGGRGFESRYPDTRKKPFRQLWKAFLCFATKHPILPVFARLTRFSTICVNRCAAAGIVNCGNCPPRRPSATMYRSHPAAAVRKHGACRRETERGNRERQWKGRRKGRLERCRKG